MSTQRLNEEKRRKLSSWHYFQKWINSNGSLSCPFGDFADRLNSQLTMTMMMSLSSICIALQYFTRPIVCYIPIEIGGSNILDYLEEFCWVNGVISAEVFNTAPLPQNDSEWRKVLRYKSNHYQWIPFILAFSGILFFLPRLLWNLLSFSSSHINDMQGLMTLIKEYAYLPLAKEVKRSHLEQSLTNTIVKLITKKQNKHFMQMERYFRVLSFYCPKCIRCFNTINLTDNYQGLFGKYMLLKLIYVVNATCQLLFIHKFLCESHDKREIHSSSWHIVSHIFSGFSNNRTQSHFFPRQVYCVADLRHLGTASKVVSSCVLPLNIINEKIFLLVWLWLAFVASLSLISIPIWLVRTNNKIAGTDFVIYLLQLVQVKTQRIPNELVRRFLINFLKSDGLFILRMVSDHTDDFIAGRAALQLWLLYHDKYRFMLDENDTEITKSIE
ncbi:Innexin inx2 [Cichlidogyrus casuarinus]|uniref:Innexin n=1 Tax=Cichlidogyrus casuarinus TaxID=1844966 RepID=A0ABD2PV37_9PLAT